MAVFLNALLLLNSHNIINSLNLSMKNFLALSILISITFVSCKKNKTSIESSKEKGEQITKVDHFSVDSIKVNDSLKIDKNLSFDKIPNQIIFNNYKIQCSLVPVKELNIKASNNHAYFDADKVEFPILIRYYKEGDYFYPFGMSKPKTPGKVGKKKLSKYFKDEKFSLLDKENNAVLFSGEKLLWLVNHRIDDRFKITDNTKSVLKMVVVDINV